MQTTNLPWWQQVTALVSLSASGAVTGFTLAPNAAAGVPAETSAQIRLLAAAQEGTAQPAPDQAATHQIATHQTEAQQTATDQTGQPAADHDTAHGAAAALRSPEPARPAVPARGATHSAGGSGGSPAAHGSADARLAQDDSALRPAIVNVASYYLRMAANKTPAEMEAIIWQHDSLDGVDHGPSCAAFASLTLELGAQAVGQQSWVTGGGSYPWPLHEWADVRVDTNPASPSVVSVQQDAQQHGRWHPLGDGYQPRPGDWVLFDGHVEVVTQYSGGTLHTIGGDSLPNFSVNAHEYSGSLAAYGIEGFVNNGELAGAAGAGDQAHAQQDQTQHAQAEDQSSASASAELADVPGSTGPGTAPGGAPAGSTAAGSTAAGGATATDSAAAGRPLSARGLTTPASHTPAGYHIHHVRPHGRPRSEAGNQAQVRGLSESSVPGADPAASVTLAAATHGSAAVPGLSIGTHPLDGPPVALTTPYSRHLPAAPAGPVSDTAAQRAFIAEVVPGAIAAQHQYGVPAAVTIAQAIDESGWGQSGLAVQDHNLFGIKGSGPAGRDWQETEEFENGQYVTRNASFRVYNDVAESIHDHGKLLATSGYYHQAMAEQHNPDAFASALTGVYATDPSYGAKLISLMRQYNLYRYDLTSASHTAGPAQPAGGAAIPGIRGNGTATGLAAGAATAARRTPRPSRGSTTPPTPTPTHEPSHWTTARTGTSSRAAVAAAMRFEWLLSSASSN
jgi:flagellum-specific peptidoglycan hydrolase FlgJ